MKNYFHGCLTNPHVSLLFLVVSSLFHRREQKYVTDWFLLCKQHAESVDTISDTTCRRHTVFESFYEVHIDIVCFIIAEISFLKLFTETFKLINRVVQFSVCIGEFIAADKEFETVNESRIIGILLGKRGDLEGMSVKECRLDQCFFNILLEEFATIDDALNSCCIEATPFREIIVAEETELVGQD